ncbi:hypothetical protein Tco_0573603 [Tanacetum coccineum]
MQECQVLQMINCDSFSYSLKEITPLISVEIERWWKVPENVIADSSIIMKDGSKYSRPLGRSLRIHIDSLSTDTENSGIDGTEYYTTLSSSSLNPSFLPQSKNDFINYSNQKARFKRYKRFFQELQGGYGYLFEHLRAKFLSRKSFDTLADHLQEVMVESFPPMERGKLQAEISSHIQQAIDINIPSLVDASVRSYMSGHILHVYPAQQTSSVPEQQYQLYLSMKADPQTFVVRPRDQEDPHDDAHSEGWRRNSAMRVETLMYEAYVTGESSGQVNEKEQDDDEVPMKQVSQYIMEEVSLTINEAELNFFANEIKKEILPHPRKTTPLVQSCQRDPEAPTLSLINQDLLYLKKGNPGPEKIVLSLHKFPTIIFNDVDIEERTSRKVNKCVKKFNPYSRYGVEHWKNPHANIFYIKRQKKKGLENRKECCLFEFKINPSYQKVLATGLMNNKFNTKIVARRANDGA